MTLVTTVSIGLLSLAMTTSLTFCILVRSLLIRLMILIAFLVSPSVVLLDNHTTQKEDRIFMAGSGRIVFLIIGMKVILLIILC